MILSYEPLQHALASYLGREGATVPRGLPATCPEKERVQAERLPLFANEGGYVRWAPPTSWESLHSHSRLHSRARPGTLSGLSRTLGSVPTGASQPLASRAARGKPLL